MDDVKEILLQHLRDHGQELCGIRQMLGGFAEALRQGHEVHKQTAAAIREQLEVNQGFHGRILVVETKLEENGDRPSRLAEWTEALKVFWPYLAVAALAVAKLVFGSAAPVMQLIEHLGSN